jgi:hypothetical protein
MFAVEPTELGRAAGRLTELAFAREHGSEPWLLVRVAAGDEELAAALRALDTSGNAAPPAKIGFHTEVVSEAFRIGRDAAHAAGPDWTSLLRTLGDALYYAIPIRKRKDVDAAFGDRVSVGRALNKDLAFRHASVSKFHAYFQLPDGDRCSVADAGSKNGTMVNGSPLAPKQLVELASGDHVTFGSVFTIVMDARTLWRVLRTR